MTTVSSTLRATAATPDQGLLDEWDELADRCGASPFARPGWISAFVEAFGGELRVASARRGGELVAVAPFLGTRRRRTPTNWHTPWFETVALDDEARRAVWSVVLDAPVAVVDHVLDGSTDAAALEHVLSARGGRFRVRDRQAPPYLELPGSWDDFVAAMSSNLRGDTRRRSRRLAERGELRFEVVSDSDDLDGLLDEGLGVEGSGWKVREGTAVVSDPGTERFYRSVAAWAAPRGMLRLCFLRVEGRAIAFDFSVEADGRHYLLKTGYDEDWFKLSPGKVLRWEVLRRCTEDGLATYEFTGDAAGWKQAWTSDSRRTIRFEAFAPSPAGRLSWLAWRIRRVAGALLGRLRRG
ncbi:MAG TPA: GNAT family N-acetyltransferase [Acidimicrobiia bacterium]|nr:GNAT family N-acetyltransferase [Acidimicrobiia bacterium]